jgi:hypothetical protein
MRLIVLLLISTLTFAQENLPVVSNFWLQVAPPNASVMAAYGELTNTSENNIVLMDAYSPAFAMTMIHQSMLVDGVAKMLHQDEIVIKSHDKLVFKPGSYHIMLMQPQFKINKGDLIKINLIYKQGEDKQVQEIWFPVEFR